MNWKNLTLFLFALLGLNTFSSHARKNVKHGYEIKVHFEQEVPDASIALAKYFGKGYPTVYKVDNAEVKNGKSATFKSDDSILGGFYMILFNENRYFAEIVLNDGDNFEIHIDTLDFPRNNRFKNSPENNDYLDFIKEMGKVSQAQKMLQKDLETAKSETDSNRIYEKLDMETKKINDYRKAYIQKKPNTFLANAYKALLSVEVPEGKHYLEDGITEDSTYAYRYYKRHFWDGFDFKDERLIHSPILDTKLEEYFTRVVMPIPDSIIFEADKLLEKPEQDKELFKYTLHYLTKFAEESNVMGMDEVFVYLVENYHMQGKAYWMDDELLEKFVKRAQQIAPNVVGKEAQDIIVNDAFTLKEQSLHDFDAEETILLFWNPTCNACLKEIPKLKKLYDEELKAKGVKVFTIVFGGDLEKIQKQIIESKIEEWNNHVITKDVQKIQDAFDAYQTPRMFFLGKDKIIEGKRLSSEGFMDFYDIYKKKKNRLHN